MVIPWLESFRAAASSEAGRPIILALATVDAAGDPQVRSVVCRRVDDDGRIWITSDARSAKHCELAEHPRAAAVVWFPVVREQFRFNGRVQILDSASGSYDREKLWRSLSPATRGSFFGPRPGESRAEIDAFTESSEAPDPPASFEVLVLDPERAEHLVLTTHPHQRRRWERGPNGIRMFELNP